MALRANPTARPSTPLFADITQGQRVWHARSPSLSAQLVDYPAGREMPRHAHMTANISVILAGSFDESIDGRDDTCGPLCVVVKPAGTVHATRVGDDDVRSLVVEVDAALEERLRRQFGLFDDCRWFHEPCGLASAVIGLCGALRHNDLHGEDAREQWFGRLGRAAMASPRTSSQRSLGVHARRAVEILRHERTIAIREIAARLGIHPVYLARIFRERVGFTPRQVRQQARLSEAIDRLVRSDEPLALLALRMGFSDQSHLTREVKRHAGVPASALRRLGSAD